MSIRWVSLQIGASVPWKGCWAGLGKTRDLPCRVRPTDFPALTNELAQVPDIGKDRRPWGCETSFTNPYMTRLFPRHKASDPWARPQAPQAVPKTFKVPLGTQRREALAPLHPVPPKWLSKENAFLFQGTGLPTALTLRAPFL